MAPTTAASPASLEALLRRYQATGDPEALGALFDATAPALFKVALASSPDAATAEDALQETYLAVIDAAEAYDSSRPAWPWLMGILRNRVREARDRVRRVPDRARLVPPLPLPGPATEAEAREREERVRGALLALPETYREVALLRWRYGLEPAEIAEVKGVPPGTVRSLLSRARDRLRRTLAGLASLLVWWPGSEPRGLAAVREEVLRRASHRVLVTSVAAGGILGGVLMAKKTVIVVAALLLLAGGIWVLMPTPVRPAGDGGAGGPVASTLPRGHVPAEGSGRLLTPSPVDTGPAVPAPTAAVTVLVRSHDDRPVEGARVEVLPPIQPGITSPWTILGLLDSRSTATSSAVTGPDGRAEVRELAPGTWTVAASRDGFARAARTLLLEAGPRGDPIVFFLIRGHALEGRVLEADGRPIPGACVVAGEEWEWGQITRTDGQGTYAFRELPWGKTMLRAGRRGGLPVEVGGVEVPAVARFDIVLPAVAVLAGTVTDGQTGTPLAGVRVEAGTWWGARGAGTATTDAAGKYAIDTIPPGMVNHISAGKEGWILPPPPPGPAGFQIVLKPGETTVRDLQLLPTGRLEGIVSGPEGPLARVPVYAGVRLGQGAKSHATESDASGRFAFALADGSTAVVNSMVPGHADEEFHRCSQKRDFTPITVTIHAGTTVRHDVHMTRGALVRGRVESADGDPLEGARVGGSVSGADGSVEFRGGWPDVTEWPVKKEGFVDGVLRVPGEVDRDVDPVVVRLARSPKVVGTVTSSSGEPLQEAFVKAFVVTGRQVRTPGGGAETLWSERAPVRPDGTYGLALPWADSGQFRVYAYAPGHAESSKAQDVVLVPGQETYTFDIVLDPAHIIRGRVLRRGTGEPIPGAMVQTSNAVGGLTDAEGRFSVSTVVASPPFLFSVRVDGMVTVNTQADPAGAETTVEMDPALEIRGVVVFPDGKPVPRAVVEARGPVTRRQSPGPDGVFGVDQLPPGEYQVVVMPYTNEPTWPFEAATVEGVRSGTAGLRVVVQPVTDRSGRISGRVLGPDRKPLNGVLVVAAGAGMPGARQQVQATSESDGTFDLTGLKVGSFTVTANPPGSAVGPYAGGRGFAPATRESVAAGTRDLEFVIEAGLSLAGTLVDAEGKALPMIGLAAGGQTATTDAEGRFAIGGLGAGEYAISVYPSLPGGVVLVQRNEKFAAGSTGIRLQAEAQKGVALGGVVRDEGGAGLAGAAVTVTAADGTRRATITRPDGTFRVGGLLPGTVTVAASLDGYREGTAESEAGSSDELSIVLARAAK